ncbi:hypothetical protein N7462_011264 [Penicillium macrosclerotiorum]|uniref:uncharacterized protein n=1 Tax=Penicillium macrosclerotiorum TaxID=303699 RepID=UPI0025486B4E|nr:uncharacterized protein N7462_011264 [Penicillium macrosclerotiorum]KAJ5666855.1 hypothetical protein N7462_011264 [Penicillium macrosclerotiorum]
MACDWHRTKSKIARFSMLTSDDQFTWKSPDNQGNIQELVKSKLLVTYQVAKFLPGGSQNSAIYGALDIDSSYDQGQQFCILAAFLGFRTDVKRDDRALGIRNNEQ